MTHQALNFITASEMTCDYNECMTVCPGVLNECGNFEVFHEKHLQGGNSKCATFCVNTLKRGFSKLEI